MRAEWWATFTDDIKKSFEQKGTPIYRVLTNQVNLQNFENVQKVIGRVGPNVAIWQHNKYFHAAAILLEPNSTRNDHYPYNRDLINLVASGKTGQDILDLGIRDLSNKDLPKPGLDIVGSSRSKLIEYIIADQVNNSAGVVHEQKVLKNRNTGTDKTHLITAQMAGIEAHPGLLIDFSATLNEGPMNDFESIVIQRLDTVAGRPGKRLLWTSFVWKDEKGLNLTHRPYVQVKDTNQWKLIEVAIDSQGKRIRPVWIDTWNKYIWRDDGIDTWEPK